MNGQWRADPEASWTASERRIMTCCSHCGATALHFGQRVAERDRARYRRRGPDPTTRLLLEELRPVARPGDTLLDIGGGIGVIGLELRASGLQEVVLVEAAPSYLAVAQDLFAGAFQPDQFRLVPGDFAGMPQPLTADIVTLDRVVCCYPDFRTLLARAAASSRGTLALSYPKDRWYVRLVVATQNLVRRLTRNDFRAFVHPATEMAAVLSRAGFRRLGRRSTLAWCVDRWARSPRVI